MRRASFAAVLSLVLAGPALGTDAPAWPTLGEQLAADAVRPGSALARLIAANQEVSLLRPEEAKDRIGVPLWLRVLWRKAHPEAEYPADDPTGGYPRALRDVHAWMISHQDLRPGMPPGHPEPPIAPEPRAPAATGELRISGAQASPRSESDIRVSPFAPMKLVAAANNITAGGAQAQFFSADGGASWGQASLPLQPGDAFHTDPAVDWTSDGTAWATTIGIDATGSVLRVRAYKSTDGGASWTFDATVSGAQASAEKEKLWTDRSAISPFQDNLYALWHDGAAAFMNRRTGSGGAWQAPVQVSGAESAGTPIGGDVRTNASGDLFGFWPATGNRRIFVVKSTDGGASYGTPVQVASTFDSLDIGVPAFAGRRALIYVSGAAYRTAGKDLVYAVWTDLSGAAGCTTAADEPGANAASTCKTRIWFTRSTNGGAAWAPAVKLNDPAALDDQFNPWLSVDETTGALAVAYYDTIADPGRKQTDLWYQSSFDDGATWTPPFKVTSAPTDETVAGADLGNQYGDYNGLSGFAGVFFPSWTDRRSKGREEIWTARIADPACTAPGSPAIGTAASAGANQVQVTWGNGAPASAAFNVYRATGTCAVPGPFVRIAGPVPGFAFTDTTVSGGSSYAYRTTGLDATGFCESAPSGCAQATATGACTLPPGFAGLASVANQAAATCGLVLAWAAGTPACAGPLAYDVHRSTSPGFTPGPGNRIATGVAGTGYTDTAALAGGTRYFYVVRAVDLGNGVADGNTVERSAVPTGPVATGTLAETFEGGLSGGGFDQAGWSHGALAGGVDWAWSTAQAQTPTHSWFADSQPAVADRVLTSPPFVPQAGTTLAFWHTFAFETDAAQAECFDAGTLEVSLDGGAWAVLPDAAFTAGGFNGTVHAGFANPLAGKRAWCRGAIGAMTQVTASLAALAGAAEARLRWHAGDDESTEATGWFVDSVTLANAGVGSACTPGAASSFQYFTVAPCRLVDTRNPNGPLGGPALQPSAQRTFALTGACGVPAGAKALAVNVTVTQPAAPGDLRLYPANLAAPLVSTINFGPGQTRANNAVVGLDAGGAITVQTDSLGAVHFILDVSGYFQ